VTSRIFLTGHHEVSLGQRHCGYLHSGQFIDRCLSAIFLQEYRPLEVIVVDNCSRDDSKRVLARYKDRIRLIENDRNAGFAAGQNQAITASRGQWVLTLNPDVLVQPGFVAGGSSVLSSSGLTPADAGWRCPR